MGLQEGLRRAGLSEGLQEEGLLADLLVDLPVEDLLVGHLEERPLVVGLSEGLPVGHLMVADRVVVHQAELLLEEDLVADLQLLVGVRQVGRLDLVVDRSVEVLVAVVLGHLVDHQVLLLELLVEVLLEDRQVEDLQADLLVALLVDRQAEDLQVDLAEDLQAERPVGVLGVGVHEVVNSFIKLQFLAIAKYFFGGNAHLSIPRRACVETRLKIRPPPQRRSGLAAVSLREASPREGGCVGLLAETCGVRSNRPLSPPPPRPVPFQLHIAFLSIESPSLPVGFALNCKSSVSVCTLDLNTQYAESLFGSIELVKLGAAEVHRHFLETVLR